MHAQPAGKVVRIGFLGNVARASSLGNPTVELIAALRKLGWTDGSNIAFDYRWSEQRNERFPELARELVALDVGLIVVTAGVTAALAAKQATSTIPILMVGGADPVKFGLVASFARPGGNVTGIMQPLVDWGKWVELAREAVPGLARVAVLANPTSIVYGDYVKQNEAAARRLGLQLQMFPVSQAQDLAPAFAAMKSAGAGALIFGPDSFLLSQMDLILELAAASKLPVIAPNRLVAEKGAVIAFGAAYGYMFSQAAVYADKLLRGTKAADLPIDQPSRFDLVINLKAARALGLTIPQSLLLRADEVIE